MTDIVCDTCNDTGQYEGDGGWYVCMDCDAALRGKVQHSTGAARRLYTQAEMDALRAEVEALRKALADVLKTREREAKAQESLRIAKENYSDGGTKEYANLYWATTNASVAEAAARDLLKEKT